MKISKVVTYSLLAQIRNTGNFINSSIDIFVPIVKYALYRFITEECQYKGESTNELRTWILENFSLPFPPTILNKILLKIGQEINTQEDKRLVLYKDGSFWIKNYQFDEFNEIIEQNQQKVTFVQKCFDNFCSISNLTCSGSTSIFDFIDSNKERLGKYLANKSRDHSQDFTVEAQFVEFFKKLPECFNLIRQIYLGSIISCYLEYEILETENNKVELIFDTNFIISLLDLNTSESTLTCKELLKVASKFGYSFRVLSITLEETYGLLMKKAENYSNTFLSKLVNPEDVWNACIRRQLNRSDLEKIADSLEKTLINDFSIIPIPYIEKYKNRARLSTEYAELKRYRNSDFAALHDITAKIYVREKRDNKRIKYFEDAKCWFVNNSFNRDLETDSIEYRSQNGYLPEVIRADDLLNILWLAKPNLVTTMEDDIVDSGLNSLISYTLNSDLPHSAIIKELDENIQKYQRDSTLTDIDIIKVATRISNKELQNIERLNNLAKTDSQKFIATIKEEAEKQEKEEKERIQRFETLLNKLERISNTAPKPADLDIEKLKRLHAINENRQIRRKEITDKALRTWRTKTWILFILTLTICIAISYFIYAALEKDMTKVSTWVFPVLTLIIEFFIGKCLYSQYYDNANIIAYESRVIIPEKFKELTNISQLPD